jgi:CheY-like chemotaxis protein
MDKIRLLLVDSNKDFFNSVKSLFCEKKYIVYYADSGKKCINILLTEIVDVVLMHTEMKDLNIYDTTKIIRSTNKISHIPLIFITDKYKSKTDFILKAFNSGATDVFFIPFINDIIISYIITGFLLFNHKII